MTKQDKTEATITTNIGPVRVWHGREYHEGEERRVTGWWFALAGQDANGVFSTKEEAIANARDAFSFAL
jgi:hypothetical protein